MLLQSDASSDCDKLATHLLRMSTLAREMSPGWDGAKVKHRVMGNHGEHVGWMLPGKGLYVDMDLKRAGITKQLPWVYEYTWFNRLRDKLRSERGAITTYDGIISGRGGGKADDICAVRSSITTVSAFWYDTYVAAGGTGPGTYLATTAPTDVKLAHASASDLGFGLTNPGGSDKKYLVSLGMSFSSAHNFAMLSDRMLDSGSYRLSVTSAETIAAPKTIDRTYGPGSLGTGCQLIAPVTTARATPGTGTWSVAYTDTAGSAQNTPASALAATADPVNRLIAPASTANPFINLASGGIGVKSITSATRVATADTTGVAALDIIYPLVFIPALGTANVYVERDLPSDLSGLIELANLTQVIGCLGLQIYAGANSLGALTAFFRTVAG